jgi:hypothetical protein
MPHSISIGVIIKLKYNMIRSGPVPYRKEVIWVNGYFTRQYLSLFFVALHNPGKDIDRVEIDRSMIYLDSSGNRGYSR